MKAIEQERYAARGLEFRLFLALTAPRQCSLWFIRNVLIW